ncbi:LPP20 family lipoprotein [Thalassolituus sp. LLYu03]|uniref:LPP20 family lipoprotein n=1 Tax=Thalassolituus sp. LLYu03 TaxID=3421656 RepID=UPI003D2D1054
MNKRILTAMVALGLVTGLSSGCMSGNTRPAKDSTSTSKSARTPEWVTQPPQQRGMAYGVGSMEIYGDPAAAIKRATELARVDLVSQLKVTVTGDFSSDTTEISGTGRQTEVMRTVRNYVRSQVPPAELDDAAVSDTYTDSKIAYVLVALDRTQAAAHLRRDILDVEQAITDIGNQPTSGTRLQQLQPLLPALKLFAKREGLSERLQLVSMDRRAAPLSSELRALQDRIYGQIDQLQVELVAVDNGAVEIAGGVLEALTAQGLRIQAGGNADLRFEVAASLSNKAQSGNQYVFVDSRITILDGSGRVLSSFSKQAKGVSGLPEVARQKAAREVATLIGDELAVALVDKIR